jgi:hypothetical protein
MGLRSSGLMETKNGGLKGDDIVKIVPLSKDLMETKNGELKVIDITMRVLLSSVLMVINHGIRKGNYIVWTVPL